MPSSSIYVGIFGRHLLINEALATLISSLPGVEVAGKIINGLQHQAGAIELSPDLWMCFFLPDEHSEVISWLQNNPQVPLLLSSTGWTGEQIKTTLQAGVYGCIHSRASVREFGEAIRQVDRGEIYLSPDLTKTLILESSADITGSRGSSMESLSDRERELIPLVCQGYSNKQIAQTLYLSVRTVENHLSNIYAKLGVNSRTELAILAVQSGWSSLPE